MRKGSRYRRFPAETSARAQARHATRIPGLNILLPAAVSPEALIEAERIAGEVAGRKRPKGYSHDNRFDVETERRERAIINFLRGGATQNGWKPQGLSVTLPLKELAARWNMHKRGCRSLDDGGNVTVNFRLGSDGNPLIEATMTQQGYVGAEKVAYSTQQKVELNPKEYFMVVNKIWGTHFVTRAKNSKK